MPKRHFKRVASPATWNIARKASTFITRPLPSGHSIEMGVPLAIVLTEYLGHAKTAREARTILNNQEVLLDGKRVKESKRVLGLMDVLSMPQTKEAYRMILSRRGKLVLVKADAGVKPCKVASKTSLSGGKQQIGLHDGSTFITDNKDYKTGDTLVLKLPERSIQEHLPLQKGMAVYLTGGKHIGNVAVVEDIVDSKVIAKVGEELVETPKRFAFVMGKGKPVVTLNE